MSNYVQNFKKFTKKAEKVAEQTQATTQTSGINLGAVPDQFKSKADEIKTLEQNIIDAKAKILQQEQDLQNKKNALNTEIDNFTQQQQQVAAAEPTQTPQTPAA